MTLRTLSMPVGGVQARIREAREEPGDVLEAEPAKLDVLAGGEVNLVVGEVWAKRGDGPRAGPRAACLR